MSAKSLMRSIADVNDGRASAAREPGVPFANLNIRSSLRALKAGEALFRAGQRTVGVFEVVSGRVRLVRTDRQGRETVLYTAGDGELIAEASLFSSIYHCDAIASTEAHLRLYPKHAVLASFRAHPDAAMAFTARLARQLMQLRARLRLRNLTSARERVRHYLAIGAEADGVTVPVNGTLKELAADLGLTHEALYRVLAEMAADGEIVRAKGRIVRSTTYDPDHTA